MSDSAQYPSQTASMDGERPAKRVRVDGDPGPSQSQGIGETTNDFNGNAKLDAASDDDFDKIPGVELASSKHAPKASDLYLDTVRWLYQPSLPSPCLRYP